MAKVQPKLKFEVDGELKGFEAIICKLSACPFKNCQNDKLGYIPGKVNAHHCYKHGMLVMKLGTNLDNSYFETLEMIDPVRWSFKELLDRKLLSIKLLDKCKNVVVEWN